MGKINNNKMSSLHDLSEPLTHLHALSVPKRRLQDAVCSRFNDSRDFFFFYVY